MNSKKEIAELKKQVEQLQHKMNCSPGMRSIYVGNNTTLIRLKGGPRIYVDSRDDTMAIHMMILGEWEPDHTQLVRNLVKDGDTFVDVGANYGYFSAVAGWLIGHSGKVYSFEPNPVVFSYLQKTLKGNGFYVHKTAKSFQLGLSDFEGNAKFSFIDGDSGGGSMYIPENRIKKENFEEINVDVSTMDIQLSDVASLDFVKIDAEGAEVGIINGMRDLIGRSPNIKILMEFYPNNINVHTTVDDFVDDLVELGFLFYRPLALGQLESVNIADLKKTQNCYILMSKTKL